CHFQASEVALHVGISLAVVLLVDQGGSEDFGGAFFFAVVDNGGQGMAFVQDVVNNQDAAALGAVLRFDFPAQFSATGFLAVPGGVHVVHLERKVQAWQQPSGKHQAAI